MKRRVRYTVICKTVPEYSKRDDVLYTCSIGISRQLGGLCRIYPLPLSGMDKWQTYELEVERNKYDSRRESWKMSSMSRKEGWVGLADDVKHVGSVRPQDVSRYLARCVSPSISAMNTRRSSIGVLCVPEKNIHLADNKRFCDNSQTSLFEDVGIRFVQAAPQVNAAKETSRVVLRIRFRDADGLHDLPLNEWHLYRGMEKFGSVDLTRYQSKPLLLLGNMHSYRTTWLGLGVFDDYREPDLFAQ